MKITLSDFAYITSLFANDLKYVGMHAAGPQFDTIQKIAYDYAGTLESDSVELGEVAIQKGEDIKSFSTVKSFIDESVWKPEDSGSYDFDSFINFINRKGHDYLEAIADAKESYPTFDSEFSILYSYWDKEINYKNASMAITNNDNNVDLGKHIGDEASIASSNFKDTEKETDKVPVLPELQIDYDKVSSAAALSSGGIAYAKDLEFNNNYTQDEISKKVNSDMGETETEEDNDISKADVEKWLKDHPDDISDILSKTDKNKEEKVNNFYSSLKSKLEKK